MARNTRVIVGLQHFKAVLDEEANFLLENLSLGPLFSAQMLSKKVCSMAEIEDFESEVKPSSKLWSVIKLLKKRGNNEFEAFLDILRNTGQTFIATKLTASLKHKATSPFDEGRVNEHVSALLSSHGLMLHKQLPMSELTRLQAAIVTRPDYNHQVAANAQLQHEVEQLREQLCEEQDEHHVSRNDLKNAVTMYNNQHKQAQELRLEVEELKHEVLRYKHMVSDITAQKALLQQQFDSTKPTLMDREQSDAFEPNNHDLTELKEMEVQLKDMENVVKAQESRIAEMNSQIGNVLGKDTINNEDSNKLEELTHNLVELLARYSEKEKVSQMQEEEADNEIEIQVKAAKAKHTSTAKMNHDPVKHLRKRMKTMKKHMEEMTREWEEERQELQQRLENTQRRLKFKTTEVRKLENQLACFSSPPSSAKARRESQVSIGSEYFTVCRKASIDLNMTCSLPKIEDRKTPTVQKDFPNSLPNISSAFNRKQKQESILSKSCPDATKLTLIDLKGGMKNTDVKPVYLFKNISGKTKLSQRKS